MYNEYNFTHNNQEMHENYCLNNTKTSTSSKKIIQIKLPTKFNFNVRLLSRHSWE